MSLAAGARLGPYQIVSPLGAGGMGEVYRARDGRLNRTVAIKVLPSESAGDADRRERFEREAKAISALDHPNICALYDVGEHEGTYFLVMPCLEGQTLHDRPAPVITPTAPASRGSTSAFWKGAAVAAVAAMAIAAAAWPALRPRPVPDEIIRFRLDPPPGSTSFAHSPRCRYQSSLFHRMAARLRSSPPRPLTRE